MIRTITTALAMTLTTAMARAAEPPVWQGEAFVTQTTGACTPNNVALVGDFFRVVYRPKLAATDPAEGLTFVGSRSVYLVTSKAGTGMLQGSGTYDGTYISSHATTGSSPGAFSLSISPFPVRVGVDTVVIFGTVTNFFATTGCDITFRSALTVRVDAPS